MKPKSADELRDQQDIADIKALLKSEANTPLNTQNAELDAPDAADIAAKRRSQRELADLVCTDSHRGLHCSNVDAERNKTKQEQFRSPRSSSAMIERDGVQVASFTSVIGGRRKVMLSRKTGIAVGLAGAIALSASAPSMASMPTAVAAIKTAPSKDTINVRWGWWPGIGVGIGLGLLGATVAAPYYYGYPYGYAGYGYPAYGFGYGYYPRPYWGWRHYGWYHGRGWRHHYAYYR